MCAAPFFFIVQAKRFEAFAALSCMQRYRFRHINQNLNRPFFIPVSSFNVSYTSWCASYLSSRQFLYLKRVEYHPPTPFIHPPTPLTFPKLPFFSRRSYKTILPAADTLRLYSPGICTTSSHCLNASADNPSRSEPNK